MKRRSLIYHLGNGLMIAAFALFVFTYYPIIQLYFPNNIQADASTLPAKGYFIAIPKIAAEAPIVSQVDPWNAAKYLPALQKGVAEAAGFASPGKSGISFLFAHSSDLPWRMTRTNTAFFRLGELVPDDQIIISKAGTRYIYKVKYTEEVWPNQVNVLKNLSGNWLVLQTCTPVGTSLKRLLVFAAPTN